MEFTINIKDSAKAKAFLNFIKSLDFVTIRESGDEIPDWQQEQLDKALQEHESGTATYTDWDKVKKKLLDQYKDK